MLNPNIQMVRITQKNMNDFKSLSLPKYQRRYVESFSQSYRLVKANKDTRVDYELKGIRLNGIPVGYMLLRFNSEPFTRRENEYYPGAMITRLLITSQYQGKGIGTQAIHYAIDLARKKGYTKLFATCVPGKYSLLHYIRGTGWKKTGKEYDGETEIVYNLY
jgi:GNAT superfamily N-acetyltransferase